ncbi:hypothetical protein [Cupriavidus sp. UYPR2.512]|uniref:hypothetical protein n=1 Tax=Cupriavidus sp. UYPR2.512 TaxID=1080187 RepID=UPI001E539183|nr:hypothetical protein [Cupriavidus sp. UYPR2.512]
MIRLLYLLVRPEGMSDEAFRAECLRHDEMSRDVPGLHKYEVRLRKDWFEHGKTFIGQLKPFRTTPVSGEKTAGISAGQTSLTGKAKVDMKLSRARQGAHLFLRVENQKRWRMPSMAPVWFWPGTVLGVLVTPKVALPLLFT